MSKKETPVPALPVSDDFGVKRLTKEQYFAATRRMDYTNTVVGHLMEMIEALGLPEKQEEAHKNQVRKYIYSSYGEACRCVSWLMDEKDRQEVFPA